MSRTVARGIFVVLLLGCQTGPDGLRMQPLPPGGQPLSYSDAIHRARAFATSATEAFYVDKWGDVEIAAIGLEETARILPKSPDIPMSLQGTLASQSTALLTDVQSLRESAKKKDEDKTNELLQRIHFRVRKMRPE
jgi:hypothetical protein